MKTVRAIIILLLCLVLPISGLAATGSVGWCPMQASSDTGSHDSATTPAAMPDCTMVTASHGDKAKPTQCKYMAQCAMANVYYPASVPTVTRPLGVSTKIRFFYSTQYAFWPAVALWHPPRLV